MEIRSKLLEFKTETYKKTHHSNWMHTNPMDMKIRRSLCTTNQHALKNLEKSARDLIWNWTVWRKFSRATSWSIHTQQRCSGAACYAHRHVVNTQLQSLRTLYRAKSQRECYAMVSASHALRSERLWVRFELWMELCVGSFVCLSAFALRKNRRNFADT